MKNESKTVLWGIVLAMLATGCRTNRTDADNTILEYQRKIAELESTISRIDGIMSDAERGLAEIENRGCDIADEIDGVIREFNAYQSRVDRLLREYNALRSATKRRNRNNTNAGANLWRADAD